MLNDAAAIFRSHWGFAARSRLPVVTEAVGRAGDDILRVTPP